jgi:hypothetical protein
MFHWTLIPPKPLYIVTGYYPEANPKEETPPCRPLLVLAVQENTGSGAKFVCTITYGTKNIRTQYATPNDVIIQNVSEMNKLGLKTPTRFIISDEFIVEMEWREPFFEPWSGKSTPILSDLRILIPKK